MKLDVLIALFSISVGITDWHVKNYQSLNIVLFPNISTQATRAEISAYLQLRGDGTYQIHATGETTDERHLQLMQIYRYGSSATPPHQDGGQVTSELPTAIVGDAERLAGCSS